MPKIDNLYAKETVVWENITTPSYFRFYVEPHHIDIDLKLEENGTTVAQGISFNLEEVSAIYREEEGVRECMIGERISFLCPGYRMEITALHQVPTYSHLLQMVFC